MVYVVSLLNVLVSSWVKAVLNHSDIRRKSQHNTSTYVVTYAEALSCRRARRFTLARKHIHINAFDAQEDFS